MQEPLQLKRVQQLIRRVARSVLPDHTPVAHQEPKEADSFATSSAVHTQSMQPGARRTQEKRGPTPHNDVLSGHPRRGFGIVDSGVSLANVSFLAIGTRDLVRLAVVDCGVLFCRHSSFYPFGPKLQMTGELQESTARREDADVPPWPSAGEVGTRCTGIVEIAVDCGTSTPKRRRSSLRCWRASNKRSMTKTARCCRNWRHASCSWAIGGARRASRSKTTTRRTRQNPR